jgi:hypothetical protein
MSSSDHSLQHVLNVAVESRIANGPAEHTIKRQWLSESAPLLRMFGSAPASRSSATHYMEAMSM